MTAEFSFNATHGIRDNVAGVTLWDTELARQRLWLYGFALSLLLTANCPAAMFVLLAVL
jgi:hypothetical protein